MAAIPTMIRRTLRGFTSLGTGLKLCLRGCFLAFLFLSLNHLASYLQILTTEIREAQRLQTRYILSSSLDSFTVQNSQLILNIPPHEPVRTNVCPQESVRTNVLPKESARSDVLPHEFIRTNILETNEAKRTNVLPQNFGRNTAVLENSELTKSTKWPPTRALQNPSNSDNVEKSHEARPAEHIIMEEQKSASTFLFNCSNIADIRMDVSYRIGKGVTKSVFKAKYKGKSLAIKMVTTDVSDVLKCTRLHSNRTVKDDNDNGCFAFPNMKLMKEILLMNQLSHPNLLKLLGYCVRSEETRSRLLSQHGIVAVYEFALPVQVLHVHQWPVEDRLRAAYQLADLLHYLQYSPLGSLILADLKIHHLLIRPPNTVVVTDLDDVNPLEPPCQPPDLTYHSNATQQCPHQLPCQQGRCHGYNARFNMDKMHLLLFTHLLKCHVPEDMDTDYKTLKKWYQTDLKQNPLDIICKQLSKNLFSAFQLKNELLKILPKNF